MEWTGLATQQSPSPPLVAPSSLGLCYALMAAAAAAAAAPSAPSPRTLI